MSFNIDHIDHDVYRALKDFYSLLDKLVYEANSTGYYEMRGSEPIELVEIIYFEIETAIDQYEY